MSFLHLYKFAEELSAKREEGKAAVAVTAIRDKIIDDGFAVEITIDAVELDAEVSLGHVVVQDKREERWDDEERLHASIRFHRKQNRCWARFVCCKEMMHVFDGPDEIVDTKEKFIKLLEEIEAKPLEQSAIFGSEYRAEWMALLVLCPKTERDKFKERLNSEEISRYDVAWHFRIPEDFVAALMSEHYDRAYQRLVVAAAEPDRGDPNDELNLPESAG